MTPCDELYGQEKALQNQIALAMAAGDDQQVQALQTQLDDVVTQIAEQGCQGISQPTATDPVMLYQLDPCLSQLEVEIASLLGIQADLTAFVRSAGLAAAEKVRALSPELVTNPVLATACVRNREMGGLWLTPLAGEDQATLQQRLSFFSDIVQSGQATYAFNLLAPALQHAAAIVWKNQGKHIENSRLMADALDFFFDLTSPNQIILNVDLNIHFKSFPDSLADGNHTATITYTLGSDAQGKLSSSTTANDVGQYLQDYIPDFGKKIVSLFPDVIPIPGTNRELVFNYDNPVVGETLGILASGRDPLLALFKVQPPPPPPQAVISGPFNISESLTDLLADPVVDEGPYFVNTLGLQAPLTIEWTGGPGTTILDPTASSTSINCDMTGQVRPGGGKVFGVSVKVTDQLGVSASARAGISIHVIGTKGGD